jgi:hypothetical protein
MFIYTSVLLLYISYFAGLFDRNLYIILQYSFRILQDYPIEINGVIAGRYQILEFLGAVRESLRPHTLVA